MNDLKVVPSHDLDVRLKDLKTQVANLAKDSFTPHTIVCLGITGGYIAACLELDSINYDVAERIVWYVYEADAENLIEDLDFQPAQALANDILADMPLPYRVVDGAL